MPVERPVITVKDAYDILRRHSSLLQDVVGAEHTGLVRNFGEKMRALVQGYADAALADTRQQVAERGAILLKPDHHAAIVQEAGRQIRSAMEKAGIC